MALGILRDKFPCRNRESKCIELPVHLRNLHDTDPFEGIGKGKVCSQDTPGIPTDHNDWYEDADITVH